MLPKETVGLAVAGVMFALASFNLCISGSVVFLPAAFKRLAVSILLLLDLLVDLFGL